MKKNNRVNFFNKYSSPIEKLSDLRLYMVIITILVFGAMLVLNIYNTQQLTIKNNQISATAGQIADKSRLESIKRYRDLIDGTALLNDYYIEIEKIDNEIKKGELIDDAFFKHINDAIPEGIKFDNIDATFEEIDIDGSADSVEEISAFQNNLEKIKQVESVHVSSIDNDEGDITFSLRCTLKEVD